MAKITHNSRMRKLKIKPIIKVFYEKRLTTVAGAWVYYFLIALVPLVFLLVTAFSVFGVSVTDNLISRLPEELRLAGQTIAKTAENASNGATVFFFLTVVFSCTTLLNQMSKDGDFIYGARSKIKRGIMRRLLAVVALAFLFSVFLGIALLFAFSSSINLNFLSSEKNQIILSLIAFFIVIVFGYIIILALNTFISPKRVKLIDILLGSFISLCIMVLGTIGFTVYLRFFSSYNVFYGSLATVVIFLLWAYILMLALAVGVIINMKSYKKHSIKIEKNQKKSVKNA